MRNLPHVLAAAIAVTGSAFAQTDLGLWYLSPAANPPINTASRGTTADANNNQVTVWDRIDKEVYAGWGVDAAFPGTRSINGLHFILQDGDLSTQDPWAIVVYTEDVANPNFPNVVTPVGTSGNFVLPLGAGAGAFNVTLNFTAPVHAPVTGDVFCGIFLQGGVTTAALTVQGTNTTVATGDKAGAGIVASGQPLNFGGYYAPAGVTPLAYSASNRLYYIQPIINGGGGVAQSITNQTANVPSNTAPGTPSQFSGAYPDGASPPLNAGRADDVAQVYFETGIPDGSPVFFLLDFGTFMSPELPVDPPLAGAIGALALNPATLVVGPLGFTLSGQAFHVLTIPAGFRPILAGLPLLSQALSFNTVTSIAHVGPASRQLF